MNNTKNNSENKREQGKFEYTIYLNDNIIVQRFFNIIGFNQRAVNSMNFKYVMDYNKSLIENHLHTKTLNFMNENRISFYEDPNFEKNDSKDLLKMVVRNEGKILGYREWDATIYPVKVRYTVDIREYIYEMITGIQKSLSERNHKLETTYMGYNLDIVELERELEKSYEF